MRNGQIRSLHESVTVLYLHVSILLLVDGPLRPVAHRTKALRLSNDVPKLVNLSGHVLVVGIEVRQEVYARQVVVIETQRVQNVLANRLHRLVIAKQINQHFFVLWLEHLNRDGVNVGDLDFVCSDF